MSKVSDEYTAEIERKKVQLSEPGAVVEGAGVVILLDKLLQAKDLIDEIMGSLEMTSALLSKAGLLLADHTDDPDVREFTVEVLEHIITAGRTSEKEKEGIAKLISKLSPGRVVH